jgi:hypothetical protein
MSGALCYPLRYVSTATWRPRQGASQPKANIQTADGRVKSSHAAKVPGQLARSRPIRKLTWLLAGPGTIWHSATRPA